MQKRALGSTRTRVSLVGLGCMGFSWGYRDQSVDEAASIDVIRRALDVGVDHFDTADAYGPFTNERLLGRALGGRRDQVVVATKCGLVVQDKASYRFGRGQVDFAGREVLLQVFPALSPRDREDAGSSRSSTRSPRRLEDGTKASDARDRASGRARRTCGP